MKAFLFAPKNFSKLFFLVYFIVGLFIFRDYGLSWDEELNRIGTALPEYNFVLHGDKESLIKSSEKYHGPSFELLLLSAERLLNITDTRPIYFLRHFITFFFFYISSILLFLLSRKIFRDDGIALICALMYILSPKIFGESFYNSKDLGFLSFFTISLYTLHRFLENKNLKNGFLHALAAGFMIDIRITGILVPLITILAWFLDFIFDGKRNLFSTRVVFVFLFYLLLQLGFIILFWPVLWLNPIHHFHEAFAQMSKYPWHGEMLFAGKIIRNDQIPWSYIPGWIAVSVPLLYSVFFVTGSVFLFARLFRIRKFIYTEYKFQFITLALAIVPLIMVIVLHSVVYDGWRHIYFVYAPFVLVATSGVNFIYKKILPSISLRKMGTGIIAVEFLFITVYMVVDHPHQHVYFNPLARQLFSPIHLNFDADYWGLSYRKGLENILARDTSSVIHVRVENDPGILNMEILTPEQRARIIFNEDVREADYYLAEFRARIVDPIKIKLTILEQLKNSSTTLLTIYKGLRSQSSIQEIFHREVDFEDTGFHKNVSQTTSVSGRFSNELYESVQASDPIDFALDSMNAHEIEEVSMEAMVNSTQPNPHVVLVFSVTRGDSLIFWECNNFQNVINATDGWSKIRWSHNVPEETIEGDMVRVYVWDVDRTHLFVDDLKVSVLKYSINSKAR